MTAYPMATCRSIFRLIEATFCTSLPLFFSQPGRKGVDTGGIGCSKPIGVMIYIKSSSSDDCQPISYMLLNRQPISTTLCLWSLCSNLTRYSSNTLYCFFDKQKTYKKLDKKRGVIYQRYCLNWKNSWKKLE